MVRSAPPLGLVVVLATLATACSVTEIQPREGYEGPAPLPPALAAPFAYAPVPIEPALETIDDWDAGTRLRGRYRTTCAVTGEPLEVRFDLFLSKKGEASEPKPVVVLLPILGGGYGVVSIIGREVVEHGWHAFFVHRDERVLEGDQDAKDLERLIRRAIVSVRLTLDWVLAREDVDRARVGMVGVSLGAIFGSLLAAVDRRVGPSIFVMGGGDLPGIVCDSWEQPVQRYRVRRMDRLGLASREELKESLGDFGLDPIFYAPYVDARRVLQIITTRDNRVPTANQWALWEALGGPRGYAVPTGHYSLALYARFALDEMAAFFRVQFAHPQGAPAAPATPAHLAAR